MLQFLNYCEDRLIVIQTKSNATTLKKRLKLSTNGLQVVWKKHAKYASNRWHIISIVQSTPMKAYC